MYFVTKCHPVAVSWNTFFPGGEKRTTCIVILSRKVAGGKSITCVAELLVERKNINSINKGNSFVLGKYLAHPFSSKSSEIVFH